MISAFSLTVLKMAHSDQKMPVPAYPAISKRPMPAKVSMVEPASNMYLPI
jgi:hypothetical protein